jgi:hypothetical protein
MTRELRWSLLTLAATLAACAPGVGDQASGDDMRSSSAHPLAADLFREAVVLAGTGHSGEYVYHGMTRESFWVDLYVRNDSATKEVGIVWSSDDWATHHVASAKYEGALRDGREQWGVDVAGFYSGSAVPEVRFAAFVTMNSQTSWSPLRNHVIYQPVTPESPVRLLSSAVQLSPEGHPFLEGKVRALNVDGAAVWVQYSTDQWASKGSAMAQLEGEEWVFRIPLTLEASVEKVEFAVRFDAGGQWFWDNNGNANYSHRLAPGVDSARFQNDGALAASGLRAFKASISSGLPITQVWVRLDGGPRAALPRITGNFAEHTVGFTASGMVIDVFPVVGLTDGPHTLALEVAAGPYVSSFPAQTFVVDNALVARGSWALGIQGGTAWDFQVDATGATYVMREHTVEKYASFAAAKPSQTFALSPAQGVMRDLTIDPAGRVYAVHVWSQVVRWLPDGTVDTSFGDRGTLNLMQSYGGKTLCYAANIEATPTGLYVADSCNVRLLRLTYDGAFVASLDLGLNRPGTGTVAGLFYDGARLWVGRDIAGYNEREFRLVRIEDVDAQPRVDQVIALDRAAGNMESFAVTPTGFWLTSDSSNLHFLDLTGTRVATWLGGGAFDQLGALDIGKPVRVLPDGSPAVLSVSTNRIERFDFRPR